MPRWGGGKPRGNRWEDQTDRPDSFRELSVTRRHRSRAPAKQGRGQGRFPAPGGKGPRPLCQRAGCHPGRDCRGGSQAPPTDVSPGPRGWASRDSLGPPRSLQSEFRDGREARFARPPGPAWAGVGRRVVSPIWGAEHEGSQREGSQTAAHDAWLVAAHGSARSPRDSASSRSRENRRPPDFRRAARRPQQREPGGGVRCPRPGPHGSVAGGDRHLTGTRLAGGQCGRRRAWLRRRLWGSGWRTAGRGWSGRGSGLG